MESNRIQLHDVDSDILWDKNLKKIRSGTTRDLGEMLFDPDEYKGQTNTLTFERYALNETELYEYAKKGYILKIYVSKESNFYYQRGIKGTYSNRRIDS